VYRLQLPLNLVRWDLSEIDLPDYVTSSVNGFAVIDLIDKNAAVTGYAIMKGKFCMPIIDQQVLSKLYTSIP